MNILFDIIIFLAGIGCGSFMTSLIVCLVIQRDVDKNKKENIVLREQLIEVSKGVQNAE